MLLIFGLRFSLLDIVGIVFASFLDRPEHVGEDARQDDQDEAEEKENGEGHAREDGGRQQVHDQQRGVGGEDVEAAQDDTKERQQCDHHLDGGEDAQPGGGGVAQLVGDDQLQELFAKHHNQQVDDERDNVRDEQHGSQQPKAKSLLKWFGHRCRVGCTKLLDEVTLSRSTSLSLQSTMVIAEDRHTNTDTQSLRRYKRAKKMMKEKCLCQVVSRQNVLQEEQE